MWLWVISIRWLWVFPKDGPHLGLNWGCYVFGFLCVTCVLVWNFPQWPQKNHEIWSWSRPQRLRLSVFQGNLLHVSLQQRTAYGVGWSCLHPRGLASRLQESIPANNISFLLIRSPAGPSRSSNAVCRWVFLGAAVHSYSPHWEVLVRGVSGVGTLCKCPLCFASERSRDDSNHNTVKSQETKTNTLNQAHWYEMELSQEMAVLTVPQQIPQIFF